MISRRQILEFNEEPAPSRLEMLKIFCSHVVHESGDMQINVSLVRMYAKEVLEELEEE